MLSVQREAAERRSDSWRYSCPQHGRASPIVLRVLTVQILSYGADCCSGAGRTGAYEWNKCAINVCMAAFTTHKREEVSVEELRAMQYIAQQS